MNCKQKHPILTWFQGIFSRKTFYGKKDQKNFIPVFLLKIICSSTGDGISQIVFFYQFQLKQYTEHVGGWSSSVT